MTNSLLKRRKHALSRGEYGHNLFIRHAVLPALILLVCAGAVVWTAVDLLIDAKRQDIDLPILLPLFIGVLGMSILALALVLTQASRSAHGLTGPIHRIVVAMQRTRSGDVGHRVHLRRDDKLKEIAAEFNRVLEWLNENPPEGVRTGTDVIEVEVDKPNEIAADPADVVALTEPGEDEAITLGIDDA